MIKWGLSQKGKFGLLLEKSNNVIHHINTQKRKTSFDYFDRCRKRIWQNSTYIPRKILCKLEIEENFLNLMKDIMKNL